MVADQRWREGSITSKARDSISAISGHSAETVKKYYLYRDRIQDVHHAQQLFDLTEPLTISTSTQEEVTSATQEEVTSEATMVDQEEEPCEQQYVNRLRHTEYGINHPEYERVDPEKVQWTDAEIAYMASWKRTNVVTVEDQYRQVSRCLAAIREDPVAQKIFHEHHVLKSDRLRTGYFKK